MYCFCCHYFSYSRGCSWCGGLLLLSLPLIKGANITILQLISLGLRSLKTTFLIANYASLFSLRCLNMALCGASLFLISAMYSHTGILAMRFVFGRPSARSIEICAIQILPDNTLFSTYSSEVHRAELLFV